MNADTKGYVERCSFEQGLCSWVQSDKNSPGAEWRRYRGDEAWPELGPHRDHTLNSAAGTRLANLRASLPTVDALSISVSPCRSLCHPSHSNKQNFRDHLQNFTTQFQLHCGYTVTFFFQFARLCKEPIIPKFPLARLNGVLRTCSRHKV